MSSYNLDSVNDIANGDQEFVVTLIEAFISEVPSDVVSMTEAVDNGNSALAYQFAHKIKPNLQSFGLHLDEDLQAIELWSKDKKEKADAEKAAHHIKGTVEEVVVSLKNDFNIE